MRFWWASMLAVLYRERSPTRRSWGRAAVRRAADRPGHGRGLDRALVGSWIWSSAMPRAGWWWWT